MNTLSYKGYTGQCEVDFETGMIFGRVIDINDIITFQSETVCGAREELRRSVDEYLAFCQELGEEPAKPFSGKILFRTTPERHRLIHVAARRTGRSVNAWLDAAAAHALAVESNDDGPPDLAPIVGAVGVAP